MSYRDLSAALERAQRLEDQVTALRGLRGKPARRPLPWLNAIVFSR